MICPKCGREFRDARSIGHTMRVHKTLCDTLPDNEVLIEEFKTSNLKRLARKYRVSAIFMRAQLSHMGVYESKSYTCQRKGHDEERCGHHPSPQKGRGCGILLIKAPAGIDNKCGYCIADERDLKIDYSGKPVKEVV